MLKRRTYFSVISSNNKLDSALAVSEGVWKSNSLEAIVKVMKRTRCPHLYRKTHLPLPTHCLLSPSTSPLSIYPETASELETDC